MEYDKHMILSIFHIIFIVPLFLYIGVLRSTIPDWLYNVVLVFGIIVFAYHAMRLVTRLRYHSEYSWVNMLHILTVAPLLIYIGYYQRDTPRFAYELLLMLGFAAGGYHLFSAVRYLDIEH